MTPTACSTTSFPASMNVLVCRLNARTPRIGSRTRSCAWTQSYASSTGAGLDGTTLLSTAGAPCSCFPIRLDRAFAGSAVEVLEGLNGRLAVQHEGRIVASQEAPPRPGILRSFGTRTVHTTVPSRYTNGVIRRSEDEAESMGTMLEAYRLRDDADRNGAARVRKPVTPRSRKPTPLQTARWKAVQKAKRKGLSIRGIAREVGIHRETVRKYIHAESPPMARPRNAGSTPAC